MASSDESNSENEFANEFGSIFDSLENAKARDQASIYSVQKYLREHKNKAIEESNHIYFEKEVDAVRTKRTLNGSDLEHNVSSLLRCITNTEAVHYALSNKIVNSQLREEADALLTPSSGDPLSSAAMQVLNNSSKIEDCSSELGKVLSRIEEKQRQLVDTRVQLSSMYTELHQRWQDTLNKDLTRPESTDVEQVTRLREKLRTRVSRMEVLVYFLETLITGAFYNWGQDPGMLEVLEACQVFNGQTATATDWTAIYDLLKTT